MRHAEKGELAVARRYVEKCGEDDPDNRECRYLVRYTVIREIRLKRYRTVRRPSHVSLMKEGSGPVPGMDTEYQEKERSASEGRSDNPDPGYANGGIFMKNQRFNGAAFCHEKEVEPVGEDRFVLSHQKHGEGNSEHITLPGMADRNPSDNLNGAIRHRNRDEAEYVLPGHEWRDEHG